MDPQLTVRGVADVDVVALHGLAAVQLLRAGADAGAVAVHPAVAGDGGKVALLLVAIATEDSANYPINELPNYS